ncbi:hypothetical protein [Taibaiella soli]|uniref:Uncharacterized protein n=1 Tax=Taibaiella soli TaxID=1649169 RepID=A0A2W2BCJ5_9BACT|nr:hypothetical protein [Taibaiella soli]PZF71386.1 hypothetical protein DN068_19030 [Taibaiella soli]
MNVKQAAIDELMKLEDEAALREILDHLKRLNHSADSGKDIQSIFERAASQYGNTLKKLAE